MEQVGQRKIDGMWLMVVGIAVLFFFDLANAYRDSDVVFGGLLSRVPTYVFLVSLVCGLFRVSRMDERNANATYRV